MIKENGCKVVWNRIFGLNIIVSILIVIITLIINFFTLNVFANVVGAISTFIFSDIFQLQRETFINWRILSIIFQVNIFFVLVIELIIVAIFQKKINKIITIKKFTKLAIIIIFIQLIISAIIWNQ